MTLDEQADLVIKAIGNRKIDNLLDIGAGEGGITRRIQDKYNCKIWLIDGNAENNHKKSIKAEKNRWHADTTDFLYYRTFNELKKWYDAHSNNYELIDCDNIYIPPDIKFDLITSYFSCGFHYPIETYYDIISKHSVSDTLCIFDIRKNRIAEKNIIVEGTILNRKKFYRAKIKLRPL